MARLIVVGAAGRMGRMLLGLAAADRAHQVMGAVEAPGNPALGKDAGEMAGAAHLGVKITEDYSALARKGTVTLDFTNAAASLENLRIAASNEASIVVGSTGFTPEMEARARELAARTPTVLAPNMSVGVNVLLRLVAEAARLLPDFDAEVLEIHHRTKVDAPSGTALALGRTIADTRGHEFASNAIYGRQGITGPRAAKQIAVMALRAGDAVGDHTVIFGGPGERLELIHRSQSREALARGALRAAAWLVGRAPGMYTMRDVLGL